MSDQYSPRRGRPPNAERVVEAAGEDRSRPERTEEVQATRRRRAGMGPERNLKLHIPESMRDPNFEYRWVNDRPGRVQQLTTLDDWDKAPEMGGSGLGTVTERAVDTYTGEKAVLLRMPKKYYDENQLEKKKALDERDDAMRRGPLPSAEVDGGDGDKTYTPGGRNIVNGR